MSKICLITHAADNDGALPIILAREVFESVEDYSCEVNEVDDTLKNILTHHEDYDKIIITDLGPSDELLENINNDEILKNKIEVYDHHQSREHQNKYSFVHVVVETNGRKECATTVFYKYLKTVVDNPILNNNALIEMIELIRELDTFDFDEDKKDDALKIGELYNIYGRDNYIENCTKFIHENDNFYFTDTEKIILKIEEERNKRYIDEKLLHVKKAQINNMNVGIVFAERNRSELGHKMLEVMNDIDIAVIINVDKSVSYRATKDDIDVNVIAAPLGGGGHKHAGGSSLPNDLQEKICEHIFKNIIWPNERNT